MLRACGAERVEDLFACIPGSLRDPELSLPSEQSEIETVRTVQRLAERNRLGTSFLGAGAYPCYIPAAVSYLASRGEFVTAYTPYQPEASQGTLQVMYEFQTMMCELTGMEVSSASMYDGASALAEAVLMAHRTRPGRRVLIARSIHPFYRQVVRTYVRSLGIEVVEIPWGDDGRLDLKVLSERIGPDVFALALQTPNFFGVVEDGAAARERLGGDALLIASVQPQSLGILAPPGAWGADIAVGDCQPLGIPVGFGGPYLGFLCGKRAHIRKFPGRIVAKTTDTEGRTGYCLTLQTREQHIRREKATSNICTNHQLNSVSVCAYLSLLGPQGFQELAYALAAKARFLQKRLEQAGLPLLFDAPCFNEFAVRLSSSAARAVQRARQSGMEPGLFLPPYADVPPSLLVAVSDATSKEEMEALVQALQA